MNGSQAGGVTVSSTPETTGRQIDSLVKETVELRQVLDSFLELLTSVKAIDVAIVAGISLNELRGQIL